MSDVIVAPSTRDLGDLSKDMKDWLQTRMPDASNIRVDNLDYPRGAGQSHETILFDAHWDEGGQSHDRGCVVRFKPISFIMFPDDLFYEQIKVMQLIHEDGRVPVAEVLWVEKDPSILGGEFYVMEQMVGKVPVSIPPYGMSGWFFESTPEQRHTAWRSSVENLARIHTFPVEKFPFLKGPNGAEQGLEQEWDKYVRYVKWIHEDGPVPSLDKALARLVAKWPSNREAGLVWGDARIGNMMFGENYEVIAVMDWEQPSLGGCINDLAWFINLGEMMHGATGAPGKHLEGMGTRAETIALWEQITGKSSADIEWYEDFSDFKIVVMGIRMGRMRGQPVMDDEGMRARLKVD
ncbi:MAG: phosphotransferase family protein [Sphingomonadaceae bacterium]|nr:phosphotransferase family protein [Sphingomonadaceae bacterium]